MTYSIYFGPKRLLIASKLPEEQPKYEINESFVTNYSNKSSIPPAIQKLTKEPYKTGVLLSNDPEAALEAVKDHFTFVPAAGGLVVNKQRQILLIYRHNKWDLPKGKLDPGEDLPTCAVREVMEETGLGEAQIVQPLSTTYHTYYQHSQHCLKASYWYLMRTNHTAPLVPQTSEGIEQCIWGEPAQLATFLANTHPAIADVLNEAAPHL